MLIGQTVAEIWRLLVIKMALCAILDFLNLKFKCQSGRGQCALPCRSSYGGRPPSWIFKNSKL